MKLPKMKNKPLFFAICGFLTVCLIVGGVLIYQHLTRIGANSTGEHKIANKLNDTIDVIPYLKDNNIYYYENGKKTLIAENVYDETSENAVYTADYAIDKNSKRMLYTSNGTLYLYDGTENIEIAKNVTAWRTSEGLENIAFTTEFQDRNDLGNLFLYSDGAVTLLDTAITPTTLRFSQSGNCIFAEKPNPYPNTRSKIFRYELDGTRTLLHENSYSIFWTNDDGSCAITGENFDDSLYSYRIFADDFEEEKNFSNVYYAEVSTDQSILFILYDYDFDLQKGTLGAVDLSSLDHMDIATDVSFFNLSAVTDSSKGVIYSVCTDFSHGKYSIYYGDIDGTNTRLIKNTTEESLYTVAINTEKKSGYILTYGDMPNNGGIYYVKWDGSDLETVRYDTGYVDSLVYYELTDTVTYIKNPSAGHAELYLLSADGTKTLMAKNCGITYNSSSQQYSSAAVLGNDTKTLMYFSDIVTGTTAVDTKGTLKLSTGKIIDSSVSSAYMEAPITCGNIKEIYYIKETDQGKDLYYFDGLKSHLIETDVDGMIELS